MNSRTFQRTNSPRVRAQQVMEKRDHFVPSVMFLNQSFLCTFCLK